MRKVSSESQFPGWRDSRSNRIAIENVRLKLSASIVKAIPNNVILSDERANKQSISSSSRSRIGSVPTQRGIQRRKILSSGEGDSGGRVKFYRPSRARARGRRGAMWPLVWPAGGERKGGLRDWKLAVKRLGKSWYYALCMGLCNGTCSPTRELASSFVVYGPIGNSTTRTWTCDPFEPSVARLIPAKAPRSRNFDLYILHTDPTHACLRRSRYFPVVCRRVTFLIVIRHTVTHAMRVLRVSLCENILRLIMQ